MTDVIKCYTSFYIETGKPAMCGIVFSSATAKLPCFRYEPQGEYLNGLLELLIEKLAPLRGHMEGSYLHLEIHIHHKNTNFNVVLNKAIKAADTARGYNGQVQDNVIKHTLTRKDHHKPACYEKMAALAKLLAEINEPAYCVTLTTWWDSKSPDQLAAYTACQGAWNDRSASEIEDFVTLEPGRAGN